MPSQLPASLVRAVVRAMVRAMVGAMVVATSWLVVFGSSALAQPQAEVVLGYGGAIVADRWNPIRVTARNAGPAVLEITIDRGSLRQGEIPYRYRAELPGGSGLVTFADDVYVPAWRSLQWRLSSEERLLASGSLSARDVDTRQLHLVVSQRPGTWRPLLPADGRVLERNGPDLSTRAASYDGVATILVDGTTAPPRPEALLAAAGTGATVALIGELPNGYADIALLATAQRTAYGNGVVLRVEPDGLAEIPRDGVGIDPAAIQGALAESSALEPPPTLGTGTILLVGAAYALAVMLALRFGRLPGVAAALVLALITSVAGWSALRPERVSFEVTSTLSVGAGGIARVASVSTMLTLPAAEISTESPAAPLDLRSATATPDGIVVPLGRWESATLVAPPSIATQLLAWRGAELANDSNRSLTNVYVMGMGPQGSLEPGQRLTPATGEESALPDLYRALLVHLPPGSALAQSGTDVLIALPPGAPS